MDTKNKKLKRFPGTENNISVAAPAAPLLTGRGITYTQEGEMDIDQADEQMDNVQKAIDLAAHIKAPVEAITFDALRSNDNGATLWDVFDKSCDEHRYVIEGETGEMLDPMECTEEEAVEAWEGQLFPRQF